MLASGAREKGCVSYQQAKKCSVLFLFSSKQVGEAKAESEKFMRQCSEGLAVRVERLVQALRQAAVKQVDSLEPLAPQRHALCKPKRSVWLATNFRRVSSADYLRENDRPCPLFVSL